MFSKNCFGIALLILFAISCGRKGQFPEKRSEKTANECVFLNDTLFSRYNFSGVDSGFTKSFKNELHELMVYKQDYELKNTAFDLPELEQKWNGIKGEFKNPDFESTAKWIEITGFLFELTEKAIYAEELENTHAQSAGQFAGPENRKIESLIKPWIFTKNLDNIHVNLYVNATIKYNHSLNGSVEITQETAYPGPGKVNIRFKMEESRYIELFVRIPGWAEGATVTEKNVKYLATPGSYCQITRKWKDGDFVEVILQ